MRLTAVCLAGWSIGCGGSNASNASNAIDAPGSIDAAVAIDARPLDAPSICDPLAAFGPPMEVAGLAMPSSFESPPHLTSDELALYFSAASVNGGGSQLYAAHRGAATARFEPPNLLPVVNAAFDSAPTVRSDGLELWFTSNRATPGTGVLHLYVAARATTSDDFSTPVQDPYISAGDPDIPDFTPFLTADGQQLWFASSRPPSPSDSTFVPNIWHATREGKSFTTPRMEPAFTATAQASYSTPVLSADQLTIYAVKTESPSGVQSLWRSHRSTIDDPFPAPLSVELGGVPGWLSADNCRLYVGQGMDIAVATRQP